MATTSRPSIHSSFDRDVEEEPLHADVGSDADHGGGERGVQRPPVVEAGEQTVTAIAARQADRRRRRRCRSAGCCTQPRAEQVGEHRRR